MRSAAVQKQQNGNGAGRAEHECNCRNRQHYAELRAVPVVFPD